MRVAFSIQSIAFHHARRVLLDYVRAIKCCLFVINIRSFSNLFRMIPTAPFNHCHHQPTPKSVVLIFHISFCCDDNYQSYRDFHPLVANSIHSFKSLRGFMPGWKIAIQSGGKNFICSSQFQNKPWRDVDHTRRWEERSKKNKAKLLIGLEKYVHSHDIYCFIWKHIYFLFTKHFTEQQ